MEENFTSFCESCSTFSIPSSNDIVLSIQKYTRWTGENRTFHDKYAIKLSYELAASNYLSFSFRESIKTRIVLSWVSMNVRGESHRLRLFYVSTAIHIYIYNCVNKMHTHNDKYNFIALAPAKALIYIVFMTRGDTKSHRSKTWHENAKTMYHNTWANAREIRGAKILRASRVSE